MSVGNKAATSDAQYTAAGHRNASVIFVSFPIGKKVTIGAIDVRGVVKQISVSPAAIEYQVAYFDDDKVRRCEWFDAAELSA